MALSVYYNPKSLFLLILEGTESLTFQSNSTKVYKMITFIPWSFLVLHPMAYHLFLAFLLVFSFPKLPEIDVSEYAIHFPLGKMFPMGENVIFALHQRG